MMNYLSVSFEVHAPWTITHFFSLQPLSYTTRLAREYHSQTAYELFALEQELHLSHLPVFFLLSLLARDKVLINTIAN